MPSTEPTAIGHSTTAELGWAAVRDVPGPLQGDVARAEACTMKSFLEGNRSALDEAVSLWEQICKYPDFEAFPLTFRLDALNRYAISCFSRGEPMTSPEEFEKAAALWRQALAWAPSGWPERAMYQHNLANIALTRYAQTGSAAELDEAIALLRLVESSTSPADRNAAMYLHSLTIALGYRYDRRGSLEDLQAAIEFGERAVSAPAPGMDRHAMQLNRLGVLYRRRFLRSGNPEDIQRATELLAQGVQETKLAISVAPRLSDLGNAVLDRFGVSSDAKDLEMAVEYQRKALELTEPDSPAMAIRLNNLGNALAKRYDVSASQEDLEATIKVRRQSVELTSASDPLLTSRLFNLGNTLRLCFEHTPIPAYFDEAVTAYRQACSTGAEFSLEWTVAASHSWGNWACRRQAWEEATEAFRYGLGAIDRLYRSQLLPSNKTSWLKDYRNLATQAAYAFAKTQRFTDAVITLEANRTRALAETLANRVARIDAATQEDRQAWIMLRERIVELQSEAAVPGRPGQRDLLDITADLRQAREALDATTTRIRGYVPGFLPMGLGVDDLSALTIALERPLTYLLTAQQGSLALIVEPPTSDKTSRELTAIPVWLDDFGLDELHQALFGHDNAKGYLEAGTLEETEMRQVLDEICPLLRERLIAPVALILHQRGHQGAILVPTGMLSLLPLYGADPGDLILSCVPSARALQSAVRTISQADAALQVFLGIGNPLPQPQPLGFAMLEVEAIADLFQRSARKLLCQELATRKQIMEQLRGAKYVHFACHGAFDPGDPLESKLFLSGDDQLSLRDLLNGELDLSGSRLVALSACRTGITDFRNVPDEAIGLPAGFMQVGLPGVISTLWSVDDVSTAALMTRFYQILLSEEKQLPPAIALHQAQGWLRTSTAKQMKLADWYERKYEASRRSDPDAFAWMTYYQNNPQVKPFEHPYFWAGFFFTGV